MKEKKTKTAGVLDFPTEVIDFSMDRATILNIVFVPAKSHIFFCAFFVFLEKEIDVKDIK